MPLLDSLAARFGYIKTAQVHEPAAVIRAEGEAGRFTIPDGSLYENQAELYQRLSWVQIAVSVTAQMAAATPLSVKRRRGEDLKDIPNHDFERLLTRPNPLMSRFELLEAIYSYRALTGNAYVWLNRPNAVTAPLELWSLPAHKITPVPDGKQYLRGYLYDAGLGRPIPLEPWEICHFRRFHPLNSFVGLSPIEALAVVATGDMAMAKWNTNHFGENNAKIPGFLAFQEPISGTRWAELKADIKAQYGGTKRALMMMQNVGKGGVEWVATAMSQKDMEFLSGRTFNREEIFATFAPGLSSVLAVNATEANAQSGKGTLVEFGVWPNLVSIAEKITNDILPSYGQNLIATFDDIRPVDKALRLKEIAEYKTTHTINQVNSEYYGDDPLLTPDGAPDPRGELFVVEIGSGPTHTRSPEDVAAADAAIAADAAAAEPDGALPPGGKALDLDRWQRKAIKRLRAGKSPVCEFASDELDDATTTAISAALTTASTVPQVAAIFAAHAE